MAIAFANDDVVRRLTLRADYCVRPKRVRYGRGCRSAHTLGCSDPQVGRLMKPPHLLLANYNIQADLRGLALTTFGRFAGSVLQ